MKLILQSNVEKLGNAGDLVDVKPGYGRNFLIPQGFAVLATEAALNNWEARKKREALKAELDLNQAEELAEQLSATNITIAVKTGGDDDKIFGSVTNANLADALAEKGIFVDRRKIELEDVKGLGEYTARVDLHAEVKAEFKLWVVKK